MTEITAADMTIRDLFTAKQMEEAHFDPELGAMYCQYIMEGKSLIKAAGAVYMSENPHDDFEVNSRDPDIQMLEKMRLERVSLNWYSKFRKWRIISKQFDDMVKIALKERCYQFVEEMVEIADDATDDAVMGATGPTINGKAIRRAELMINTRKFVASKLLPQVFGDKTQMEITGADGKDLVPATFNINLIPAGHFVTAPEAENSAEDNV